MLGTPLSGGWNDSKHDSSQHYGAVMSATNRPSIYSTHDPLDIGRNLKVNKFGGIIEKNDVDYHKAYTIKVAQANHNH